MNRNRIGKAINVYEAFDRVGLEIPQLPHIAKLVVSPIKVVFINRAADPDANIDRLFRSVEDFTDFCDQYWIELP